jgi:molybdenum cofactor synthesis domain-containing protein
MALVPLAAAQALVLGPASALDPIRLPLRDALDHVLAEAVVAQHDVPPFDNSAMDGYALRAADATGAESTLSVIGVVAAGHPGDMEVGAGQATRIMTGAPIPRGADSVIMVEQTETSPDGMSVRLLRPVDRGDHVRRAGSDMNRGAVVIEPGAVLGPSHLGVLASVGAADAAVHPRPRVGVMSTGDELADPGSPLEHGQIRDSNRVSLISCLERDRFVPVDLGIVADDEHAVRERLEAGLAECDALITSGGVSVGDFDHVKRIVTELARERGGATGSIGVAIRPAKPFAYGFVAGHLERWIPVLGLPGNPVSSLVSYELLARPVLRTLAGHGDPVRAEVTGRAGEEFARQPDSKTHFVRVRADYDDDGVLVARSCGGQGSHQLATMTFANALAVIPDGYGVGDGDRLGLLLLGAP